MDLMHVTQDREQLQALVNTIMNLRVPKKEEAFLTE
jgi:hypothetical protein